MVLRIPGWRSPRLSIPAPTVASELRARTVSSASVAALLARGQPRSSQAATRPPPGRVSARIERSVRRRAASDRPITVLATAVPRLIRLAVASNVLHVLPDGPGQAGVGVAAKLVTTIHATATGSLHRCSLALEADSRSRRCHAADCFRLQEAQRFEDSTPTSERRRWSSTPSGPTGLRRSRSARLTATPQATSDCVAHLLVVCVPADEAGIHRTARSPPPVCQTSRANLIRGSASARTNQRMRQPPVAPARTRAISGARLQRR